MPESELQRIVTRVKTRKSAVISFWSIIVLAILAFLSPFVANEKPLIMKVGGKLYFPVIYDLPFLRTNPDLIRQGFTDVKTFKAKVFKHKQNWMIATPIPYSANTIRLTDRYVLPGKKGHVLGSDDTGRDVASRLLHGIKISLTIGVVAMGIAFVIGVVVGALAGYFGGWVDIVISRIIEIVMSIPVLLLLLILIAALKKPTIYHTMAIIGLTGWTSIARIFRGEVLKIRNRDYVTAARGLGTSVFSLLHKHILPNAIAPVLVSVTFGIASAILTESMLSFLGFGDPSFPSWGEIIDQGRRHIQSWHLVVFPGIAIFFTVTIFNLLGDALRDAIAPKTGMR